ncbi:MAG: phospholipase A [Burkholderiales bacterium]
MRPIWFTALTLALAAGQAQAYDAQQLERCANIQQPDQRLACFDAAVPRPVPSERAVPEGAERSPIDQRWAVGVKNTLFDILPHKPTYLLLAHHSNNVNTGPFSPTHAAPAEPIDLRDTEAMFQLSFKFRLVDLQDSIGASLWAGYTQQSQWQVYNPEQSRPFRETNYEPELMLAFHPDREFLGLRWRLLNFGLVHQSNGQSDPLSRSWNRLYAQFGLERGGFELLLRPWWRVKERPGSDDNPDIVDYMGHGDAVASYHFGRQTISALGRYNARTGKGALQASWSFPMWRRVNGYVQAFTGYGESLIDYNWKQTTYGLGIALTDWQ